MIDGPEQRTAFYAEYYERRRQECERLEDEADKWQRVYNDTDVFDRFLTKLTGEK